MVTLVCIDPPDVMVLCVMLLLWADIMRSARGFPFKLLFVISESSQESSRTPTLNASIFEKSRIIKLLQAVVALIPAPVLSLFKLDPFPVRLTSFAVILIQSPPPGSRFWLTMYSPDEVMLNGQELIMVCAATVFAFSAMKISNAISSVMLTNLFFKLLPLFLVNFGIVCYLNVSFDFLWFNITLLW